MIEKLVPLKALQGERHFRWRGGEISRIEAMTDAVFALALTLLIVSVEVPARIEELFDLFRKLPAFAVCFALFALLWYYHFQFHRRFGLENLYTIFLNICFLFLILFYVYPTKFLFSALVEDWFYDKPVEFPSFESMSALMIFYSGGVVGIFLLLTLMYLHAWEHRDALELDEVERHMTRTTIREHLIHVAIGALSILLAFLGQPKVSGLIYILVGPLQFLNGWLSGRAVRAGRIG